MRRLGKILSLSAALVGGMLLLTGCASRPPAGSTSTSDPQRAGATNTEKINTPATPVAPSYHSLVAEQTARLKHIKSFWSSVGIKTTWNIDGEEFKEEADGHLIFKRDPDRIALTFGRLGKIYVWFGADDESFWLFEQGDQPRAYMGRNVNAMDPASEQLPMLVHPAELIDLLGVFEWPTFEGGPPPLVLYSPDHEMFRVRIPGRWSDRRVYLDAMTHLPRGVELVDRTSGRVVARAELTDYGPMKIKGLAPGDLPLVPKVVQIWGMTTAGDVDMRLRFREPSDTQPRNRPINNAAFNFNQIGRTMRPEEIVILDRNCTNPATVDEP